VHPVKNQREEGGRDVVPGCWRVLGGKGIRRLRQVEVRSGRVRGDRGRLGQEK